MDELETFEFGKAFDGASDTTEYAIRSLATIHYSIA